MNGLSFTFMIIFPYWVDPVIHDKLVKHNKIKVSQKTVAIRMRVLGLFATKKPKKYINTTDSNHRKTCLSKRTQAKN